MFRVMNDLKRSICSQRIENVNELNFKHVKIYVTHCARPILDLILLNKVASAVDEISVAELTHHVAKIRNKK
jgi:hypothetical protein